MSAEDFVKETIKSHKIVIFSKSYCPFCKMAKKCFSELNVDYFAIELDNRQDGDQIQDALESITGSRTVPKVYVYEKLIGGGTDVKNLHAEGKLAELIAKEP